MVRWSPERRLVIEALADELLHNYGRGRTIVAVDGPEGAGMAVLADDLATELRRRGHAVVRASIDGFRRPRAERDARGPSSAEGAYRDAYDYSAFRRVLVEPFRMGEGASVVTATFDHERDVPLPTKWITAPVDALLLVDGVFLLRPELRGLWNASIWLETPSESVPARRMEHEGASGALEDQATRRERGAQELYRAESSPRSAATIILNAEDPEHPRRVFADSC